MNPVLVGSKVICSLLSCFVFVVGSFKHAGDHHLEVDKVDKQLFHINFLKFVASSTSLSLTEVSGLVTNSQAVTGESQRHWLGCPYSTKVIFTFQLVWSVSFPSCSHIVS